MTAPTEATDLELALSTVESYIRGIEYDEGKGAADGLREALATLQARLLAADELREAAERLIDRPFAMRDRKSVIDALAAYKQAGMGGES